MKSIRKPRSRMRPGYFVVVTGTLFAGYASLFFSLDLLSSANDPNPKDHNFYVDNQTPQRHLLSISDNSTNSTVNATTIVPTTTEGKMYPPELFTETQLKQGAVVLHCIGIAYMFVALAIVCDEFLVPSLMVIVKRLEISEDVAGATFMAAGGSMPELFASLIATFFAKNNVGIGTIVGSAVFNILFVIGMCVIFSKGVLHLTWWPLFRDVCFYSISLALLIAFFHDASIAWWEALLLMVWYCAYVVFMKFNARVEVWVKSKIARNKVTTVKSTDNLIVPLERPERTASLPILHGSGGRFRHGVLQLMIHTIDPLAESHIQDRAVHLQAIASLNVTIDADGNHSPNPHGIPGKGGINSISNGRITMIGTFTTTNHYPAMETTFQKTTNQGNCTLTTVESLTDVERDVDGSNKDYQIVPHTRTEDNSSQNTAESQEPLEDDDEPMDLSWPDTTRARIYYVFVAPLVFTQWITMPDVRKEGNEKLYPITFTVSIIWIALYSYAMVWWADIVGTTAGIPDAAMGLTFIAAGTSVPDLITSVIVARKGFGDMAVSSSIGSNIFDITMGLPFPWLLNSLILNGGGPNDVNSNGIFCSILLLFGMLMLVIISIAAFKWKMSKGLGVCMFLLYAVFITFSLLFELKEIPCLL